ncbi:TM2 domain-containing protein [Acidithiobacillus sp. HP-6]|uniref:TM2 domain-containing protein n=1 Tax=Acidithiobacillus sp. HP-6 TaxID=2697655 RepID=UPI001D0D688C|nr:TM2 domain-containing protein [Acidithiobacillus sp. HP-6]
MPSKQVILNADGTYSLPFWGGKFWTKKITGRVTYSNVNHTEHYSSSYQTLETTVYYGRSGYIGSFNNTRTHTVNGTLKSSYFSLKDDQGNTHTVYVDKHIGIAINEGDLVTVIKSDSIRLREATTKDDTIHMDVQVKYILNHTTKRSVSLHGESRIGYGLMKFIEATTAFPIVAGFFIALFGYFLSNMIFGIGLALLISPFVLIILVAAYFYVIGKTKADILIPYFSIVARSNDGKVSQAELSEAYKSGKYYIYQKKNRFVAAALALFTGVLGFHKFYLGYYKQGFIMLSMIVAIVIIGSIDDWKSNNILISIILVPRHFKWVA